MDTLYIITCTSNQNKHSVAYAREDAFTHTHTMRVFSFIYTDVDSLSMILVNRWKLANSIKHFIIVCPINCIHSLIRPVRSVSVHSLFSSLSLYRSSTLDHALFLDRPVVHSIWSTIFTVEISIFAQVN